MVVGVVVVGVGVLVLECCLLLAGSCSARKCQSSECLLRSLFVVGRPTVICISECPMRAYSSRSEEHSEDSDSKLNSRNESGA